MRLLDLHTPPRSRLAWTALLLAGLVVATILVLPLVHGALHEAGAPESECPVHILQAGLALVLLVFVALSLQPAAAVFGRPQPAAAGPLGDPRRSPLAPRAPPFLSHLSR